MSDTEEDIEDAPSLSEDSKSNLHEDKSDEWFSDQHDEDVEDETIEYYDSKDYISEPKLSENGTLPTNIIEFDYSLGYDCQRFFNICVADSKTLVFASGNLINFFDVHKKKLSFRRCSTGGGIGHITKNPAFDHIAVGENGKQPPIIIYEWPSLEIVTVLKKGTNRSYSHLAYSPDGSLLVSQGGEPDYFITIWNWQNASAMLRCKSHGQDVYRVMFSPTMEGHLTTCGSAHVKLWKMAKTFTGFKLKGELGRFEKTEISDVLGVYPMPDEKVVSGCEWGNILLWVEGLIKLQVCRKNRKPCHSRMISQFEFADGELMSVGMDGWVRVWYYETIDQADPPDDDRFLELEPTYEFFVGENRNNAMLMSMQKQDPSDLESSLWFAQDGNGGLWSIDLSMSDDPRAPEKLFSCHAGAIADVDVADWGPFVASCGNDGRLHIYNYAKRKLILVHKFRDACNKVTWFPCEVENSGSTIACAFESGVIRIIAIDVAKASEPSGINGDHVRLLQVLKPHKKRITDMVFNPAKSLLITGGEDAEIFLFRVKMESDFPVLEPIGFVKMPSAVSRVTWKSEKETTVLIGCSKGQVSELTLPEKPQPYTTISYELVECKLQMFTFQAPKSQGKQEKIAHEAEVPSRVSTLNYSSNRTVLLTMSGDHSGHVYEFARPASEDDGRKEPVNFSRVPDAENTEICSWFSYNDGKYLFLGLGNGEVRVCRVNPSDETDLSDYWSLPMHDNFKGRVSAVKVSPDGKMLFSCGQDGNLFSFFINVGQVAPKIPKVRHPKPLPAKNAQDIEEPNKPTLEEIIVEAENDRIFGAAMEKKNETLETLRGLAEEYRDIWKSNQELPESQRVPEEEFELDKRITKDLERQLNAEKDQMLRELVYKEEKSRLGLKKLMDHFIEPLTCVPFAVCKILKPGEIVHCLRELKLNEDFSKIYDEVTKRLEEEAKAGRTKKKSSADEETSVSETDEENAESDTFLDDGLSMIDEDKMSTDMKKLVKKYKSYKVQLDECQEKWKMLNTDKPDPDATHPSDAAAIEEAKNTIGDYILKSSPDCNKRKDRDTVLSKYKQVLSCRKRVHHLREDFNAKLRACRSKKLELRQETLRQVEKLKKIHVEIPESSVQTLPMVVEINDDVEFPERRLQIKVEKEKLSTQMENEEPIDEEYMMLFMDRDSIQLNSGLSSSSLPTQAGKSGASLEILRAMRENDLVETPVERDLKRARLARKIYEQDCILKRIQKAYENFDLELDELEVARLNVVADCVYADLLSLTFNQELVILRDYEEKENRTREKVEKTSEESADSGKKVQIASLKIERKTKEIGILQDKVKDLQAKFVASITNDKFRPFLKKIFQKKYSPPKAENESSSSSETSSDDTSSGSEDLELLYLNENVCPAKCDRELYDDAFTKREMRYEYEKKIKEEQKDLEFLKKEFDYESQEENNVKIRLRKDQDDLEAMMHEKQQKLNEVDITVILKLQQLQHVSDTKTVEKIEDCLLFDKTQLSKLYARVGELEKETEAQKEKQKKYKIHLQRIKIDCEYMESEVKRSKSEIKEEMIKKFGKEVSLLNLYQSALSKMLFDMKADFNPTAKKYENEIKRVKKEYEKKFDTLQNVVKENTEALHTITVLKAQETKLKKMLKQKTISEKEMLATEQQYQNDVVALENIILDQMERKSALRREIKNLSSKSRLPQCDFPREKPFQRIKLFSESSKRARKGHQKEFVAFDKKDKGEKVESDGPKQTKVDKDSKQTIRDVFLQIIETIVGNEELEQETQKLIKDKLLDLPLTFSAGELQQKVRENIEGIVVTLKPDDEETMKVLESIQENLNEILFRLDVESEESNVKLFRVKTKEKLRELLESIGIEQNLGTIEQGLIKDLEEENDVNLAAENILQHLPPDTESETVAALYEHVVASLIDIFKQNLPEHQ